MTSHTLILAAIVALVALVNPSAAISCLSRDLFTSSTNNGSSMSCSSIYSTCYQYETSSGTNYAGCGTCSSYSSYECRQCSTDNCNVRLSSSLSCYSRSLSTSTSSEGSRISCYSLTTTCYKYTFGGTNYAGCGGCSTILYSDCRTCSTSYCNTRTSAAASLHGWQVRVTAAAAAVVAMLALMKPF